MIRRKTTSFHGQDATDAASLIRALNEFSASISRRMAELEAGARVAVLEPLEITLPAAPAVNAAPYPIQVQVPFSVAGAWVVSCVNTRTGEAGITANTPGLWGRAVSGGPDGIGNAFEIQFLTGLAASTSYQLRIAVVGVKNG